MATNLPSDTGNFGQYVVHRKMDSRIALTNLDGLNYDIWVIDMKTLLKIKGIWKYTQVSIPYQFVDQEKFVIDGNKYEVVGVITTHMSHDI